MWLPSHWRSQDWGDYFITAGWNPILYSVCRATGFDSEDRGEFCIHFYSRPQHTHHVARLWLFRSFYSFKMTFRGWVILSVLKLTFTLKLASIFSPISVVVFRISTDVTTRSSIIGLVSFGFWLNYGNSPSKLLGLGLIRSTLRWFNL